MMTFSSPDEVLVGRSIATGGGALRAQEGSRAAFSSALVIQKFQTGEGTMTFFFMRVFSFVGLRTLYRVSAISEATSEHRRLLVAKKSAALLVVTICDQEECCATFAVCQLTCHDIG